MYFPTAALIGTVLFAARNAYALDVDISSTASINSASKCIASRIVEIYNNGSTIPGLFAAPYYWWESGLAWDSMINYWALTGDDTYNDLVAEAVLFQTGPDDNFMPPNQTKSEGNDDESFWALAAMTAAERGFPLPTMSNWQNVSWVQLAQNVFNSQVARWDTSTCGGGLRWQIFTFNNGYNYKNSLSNGNFVQLAARLARYTGNQTYNKWAEKAMQWSFDVGMISNATGSLGAVWDGTSTTTNCSQFNHIQWTASAGTYLSGSAYAENTTQTMFWNGFTFALWDRANATFTENFTLTEVACEPNNNCDTDQLAFKGILARALANTRDLTWDSNLTHYNNLSCAYNFTCPGTTIGTTHGLINEVLQTSAKGAAAQCSGGSSGSVCGSDWTSSTWDGTSGLGQELNALEVLLAVLPGKAPLNNNSTGNGTATASSTGGNGSNGTSATGGSGSTASASVSAIASNGAFGTFPVSMFALVCSLGFAVALLL